MTEISSTQASTSAQTYSMDRSNTEQQTISSESETGGKAEAAGNNAASFSTAGFTGSESTIDKMV